MHVYFYLSVFVVTSFIFSGPVGGYCSEPGECLCREGFVGDNCSVGECHLLTRCDIPHHLTSLSLQPPTPATWSPV